MNKTLFSLVCLLLLIGCSRSHVIKVNVINNSPDELSNVIIDYPSATFGIPVLRAGKNFQYTIKVTDNGAVKIEFADVQGRTKRFPGPAVRKDDDGTMEIRLTQDNAVVNLEHHRSDN